MHAIARPFGDDSAVSPLFVGQFCAVFRHRCHPSHPDFGARITVQAPVVVFPRTAFRLAISGEPQLVVDRNCLVFLRAGDVLERQDLGGQFADSDLLAVDCGALQALLDTEAERGVGSSLRGTLPARTVLSTPRLYLELRRLVSTLPSGVRDPQRFQAQLMEILWHVVRLCRRQDPASTAPAHTTRAGAAIAHARALLASRVGAPLTLEEVAAAVHLSPYHLTRVFKRHYGTSIHAYWMRLTMAHSLSLLRDPALSIAGVSNRLGFCAHSHFSSTFRRHFGITPRSFVSTLRQETARRPNKGI